MSEPPLTLKEKAFKLFDEGHEVTSDEVKAAVPKYKTRYNYWLLWQKKDSGNGPEPEPRPAAPGAKQTAPRGPLTVGRIMIAPEDWVMSQEGALIILDTFIKDRQNINYGGTVGDHIVDVYKYFRKIMGYEEVDYGGDSQGTQGGGGNGQAGVGPPAIINR